MKTLRISAAVAVVALMLPAAAMAKSQTLTAYPSGDPEAKSFKLTLTTSGSKKTVKSGNVNACGGKFFINPSRVSSSGKFNSGKFSPQKGFTFSLSGTVKKVKGKTVITGKYTQNGPANSSCGPATVKYTTVKG